MFDQDFVPDGTTMYRVTAQIPGMVNPRSLLPTSSIIFETLDANQNTIDRIDSKLEVSMVRPGELTDFLVRPDSLVNGEQTIYQF
jgi:hypothetical protein